MKEIELQISQFIDNELTDTEQKELFTTLAESENARRILSDFMQLKKETSNYYASINTDLLPRAINRLKIENKLKVPGKYKVRYYLSLAASFVMAMLLFWNQGEKEKSYSQLASLENQYTLLKNEYTKVIQIKKIDLVDQKTEPLVKSINKNKGNKFSSTRINLAVNQASKRGLKQYTEMLQYSRATITKEDFIGGQIVGN